MTISQDPAGDAAVRKAKTLHSVGDVAKGLCMKLGVLQEVRDMIVDGNAFPLCKILTATNPEIYRDIAGAHPPAAPVGLNVQKFAHDIVVEVVNWQITAEIDGRTNELNLEHADAKFSASPEQVESWQADYAAYYKRWQESFWHQNRSGDPLSIVRWGYGQEIERALHAQCYDLFESERHEFPDDFAGLVQGWTRNSMPDNVRSIHMIRHDVAIEFVMHALKVTAANNSFLIKILREVGSIRQATAYRDQWNNDLEQGMTKRPPVHIETDSGVPVAVLI